MKIFLSFFILISSIFTLNAQSRLFDRVEDVSDFCSRITKVVIMNENSMIDLYLKDAVQNNWELSPYEFCSKSEFENLKTNSNYYFLLRVEGDNKKDRSYGMNFITLLKGGENAKKGIDHMPELVTLPLMSTGSSSDRIFSFLPSYMNIIQNHVKKMLEKNINSYLGMLSYGSDLDKINNLEQIKVLFLKSDISYDLSESKLKEMFNSHARYVSEDEIEKAIIDKKKNTLVSLCLYSDKKVKKNICYKMLIRCSDSKLFFYRTHKINRRRGKGLLKEDLRRLSTPFSL